MKLRVSVLAFPYSLTMKLRVSVLVFSLVASPLGAQGIAAVAVPKSGENAVAVYRAKVRELVTTLLQNWTESLERKDSVAVASVYVANARSFLGDLPEAATAAEVVKQLFKTPLAGGQLAITVDDFDMSGDLAFVTSVLVAKIGPADSAPAYIRSLFVFHFDDWHNRWQVREQFLDWRGADATLPAQ
jgi:ketosteroid isomerase-like protein